MQSQTGLFFRAPKEGLDMPKQTAVGEGPSSYNVEANDVTDERVEKVFVHQGRCAGVLAYELNTKATRRGLWLWMANII